MNPRMMLEMEFRSAREKLLRGKRLTRDQLRRLAAMSAEWFGKLLLPHLDKGQRMLMARGDLPGMQQLFLAVQDLLLRHPDLSKALDLLQSAVDELRQKAQKVSTIAGRAETLQLLLGDLRRQIVATLIALNKKVLEAAQRLKDDPTLTAKEREQVEACLTAAGHKQKKRQKAAQARKERKERTLGALREKAAQARLPGEIARLSRALLGGRPAAAPAAPPPAAVEKARRRPAAAEDDEAPDPGAPLSRCLEGPLADLDACAEALWTAVVELGETPLTDAEREGLERGDSLAVSDLAGTLATFLRNCPRLAQAAGTTADELEELCHQLMVLPPAERNVARLAQGARDGTLVVGMLLLVCHDEARAWLRRQIAVAPAAEQAALQADLDMLDEALRKAEARQAEHADQTRREREAAEAEVAEAEAAARYEEVMERLRAGEQPSLAELVAAERFAQRRAAAEHARPDLKAPASPGADKKGGRSRRR